MRRLLLAVALTLVCGVGQAQSPYISPGKEQAYMRQVMGGRGGGGVWAGGANTWVGGGHSLFGHSMFKDDAWADYYWAMMMWQ